MNGWVCQNEGREQAVAVACTHCGATLSQEHFVERQTRRISRTSDGFFSHVHISLPASAR